VGVDSDEDEMEADSDEAAAIDSAEPAHDLSNPNTNESNVMSAEPAAESESSAESEPAVEPELTMSDINEGDFVVVEYKVELKKTVQQREYVASIVKKYANRFDISCLRVYKSNNTTFHYPHIADFDSIKLCQIKKKLPEPKETRGIYRFSSPCFSF
jgi:hypothetical protein